MITGLIPDLITELITEQITELITDPIRGEICELILDRILELTDESINRPGKGVRRFSQATLLDEIGSWKRIAISVNPYQRA